MGANDELSYIPRNPKAYECLAEFGSYFSYFTHHPDIAAHTNTIRNWINSCVESKSQNPIFMDTTTIYTAFNLLKGDTKFLTPMSLLDLANVTNAIVLNDNIFHLQNTALDSRDFNEYLGNEPVFIEIPVFSSPNGEAIGSLLRSHWLHSQEYVSKLAASKLVAPSSSFARDAEQVKNAWQQLFGVAINWDRWHEDNSAYVGRTYGDASDGQAFVREVATLFNEGAAAVRGPSFVQSGRVGDFINECNSRSLFNWSVAYALKLQYVPNSFRLPLHQFLYSRGVAARQHLVKFLDSTFQKSAEEIFGVKDRVHLPFFLSAVLSRSEKLDELSQQLADLRLKAGGFRGRVRELNQAIADGKIREAKRLMKAINGEEAPKLWTWVAGGSAILGLAWIGAVIEQGHPGTLHALTVPAEIFGPVAIATVAHHLYRQRFRFIANLAESAGELTNLSEKVSALWHVKQLSPEFIAALDRLKKIDF